MATLNQSHFPCSKHGTHDHGAAGGAGNEARIGHSQLGLFGEEAFGGFAVVETGAIVGG